MGGGGGGGGGREEERRGTDKKDKVNAWKSPAD